MAFNRATMNLNKRMSEAASTAEQGGVRGLSIIDVPQGTQFFKLDLEKAGKTQYLNIIPWAIETDKHPSVVNGTAQIGDGDFVLDVWTHRLQGVTPGNAVCVQKTYGRACPSCAELQAMGQSDRATRRSIFWVQECDAAGNPLYPEPKLFIAAHNCFTKELLEEAAIQGNVPFADPSLEGKIVSFRVRQAQLGGGVKFAEATHFDFVTRRTEIPQAVLDKAVSLDKLLHIPTKDEVIKSCYGTDAVAGGAEAADQAGAPAQGPESEDNDNF